MEMTTRRGAIATLAAAATVAVVPAYVAAAPLSGLTADPVAGYGAAGHNNLNVLTHPDGCYTLQAVETCLVVDPSKKGAPGDIVAVWPRKKGPIIARRLARGEPYSMYYFRALATGEVFRMKCNKVSAIHAVVSETPA